MRELPEHALQCGAVHDRESWPTGPISRLIWLEKRGPALDYASGGSLSRSSIPSSRRVCTGRRLRCVVGGECFSTYARGRILRACLASLFERRLCRPGGESLLREYTAGAKAANAFFCFARGLMHRGSLGCRSGEVARTPWRTSTPAVGGSRSLTPTAGGQRGWLKRRDPPGGGMTRLDMSSRRTLSCWP